MSAPKMKGFFRYITNIFESGKEEEMQIGLPTDVKHVAHIGWDGPSVNTPSWMNEFKSAPSCASSAPPRSLSGRSMSNNNNNNMNMNSERDLPDLLPKSSKRQSSGKSNVSVSVSDSPIREKSEKSRQSRRSCKTKDSSSSDPQGSESPAPEIPRKNRRKKSKESSAGSAASSTKTKVKKSSSSDPRSPVGSETNSTTPFDERNDNGSNEDLFRNFV